MTLIHLAHGQKNEWRKHYERKSNRAKINADGKKSRAASVRSSFLLDLMGCRTESFFCPEAVWLCGSKGPRKKPRALQTSRHALLRRLGFRVYVLDNEEQIEGFLMRYAPHDYQAYAIDYIETHPIATVFLDMGLGKTSITLTAISNLLFDSFEVHRVLVIAPLACGTGHMDG